MKRPTQWQIERRQTLPLQTSFWPAGLRGWLVLGWLLTIHATAALGLLLYPVPGFRLLLALIVLAFLGGLSTTVCYHRALAHRSLKLNRGVRTFLVLITMLSGQTPPRGWVATHRLHHATADTPADPSSPVWRGFWFAHIGWHWQADKRMRANYAGELNGTEWRMWDLLLPPIFAVSFFGGVLFGMPAMFWVGAIRLVFVFHTTSVVNSVCHTQTPSLRAKDCSRNVWWVAALQFLLGENWHRNHHRTPSSARFGLSWRQPDLGYVAIVGLERLGLASHVHHPRRRSKSSQVSTAPGPTILAGLRRRIDLRG